MEQWIKITEFQKKIDKQTVFSLLDCREESPTYEQMNEEFEEILEKVREKLHPAAVIGFGEVPGTLICDRLQAGEPVVYVLATVGKEISTLSADYFDDGDFLKGMLADSMADACLFAMDEEIEAVLKKACADRKIGITSRLEAPEDIPMTAQKAAYDALNAGETLGISISPSYMYDPVKTSCQVMQVTEDVSVFKAQHNCRTCSAQKCHMRSIQPVTITVQNHDRVMTVVSEKQESILDALNSHGAYFSAVCGGTGHCGKCRIRLLSGELAVTASDRLHFTEEELAGGWRLACMAFPTDDCVISMDTQDESGFSIQVGHGEESAHEDVKEAGYDIAIDIGTTTLAFQLVGKTSRSAVASYATLNRQRAFGADVISRIQASVEGKKEELRESIRGDLMMGIHALLNERGISPREIDRIAIGGNTTMGHLLMGFDCKGLGRYPFIPVDISLMEKSFSEVMGNDELDARVFILPGISTYVGGDIVSGLYNCDFGTSGKVALLVDLGTNGEMAIGNQDRIVSTSTAAGPAFEGGNISWGMGSVQGAICHVEIEDGKAYVETIDDKPPVGLCGTGVIETISELVEQEYVDETGRMEDEEYFRHGFPLAKTEDGKTIVFTQKDVREIQLAKSAVRAGIEVLLRRFGVTYDEVEKVYLAGGFGYHISQDKAMAIGLLPEEFEGKIDAVGNSSLGGALRFLIEDNAKEEIEKILERSTEIDLSTDRDFNSLYMEHMYFA